MNKIKVTFLNPPYLKNYSRPQRSPSVTKSGTLYFPMWLSYAAGYMDQGGHEIDLIDAPAARLQEQEVIEEICLFSPRLLVIETSTPSIFNDARFCGLVKKELPHVVIVMVGTHVSALPESSLLLDPAIDAIAIGEYDLTVKEIADALGMGSDYTRVAGLCFRGDSDKPTRSGSRKPLKDLDTVPMVSSIYKRFLDIRNYFNPNALFPMVTITTSRGCPHHCTFCVYPQTVTGNKVRLRSVNNVVDEIEYITRSFPGVKSIFFEDDTFAANKTRCQQICREIMRRDIHIAWTANARADLDYETMSVMKKAGCRSLCVGFESGNQELLDNIKKRITLDQSREFMTFSHKTGMLIHGCFIVGLPGETQETMEKTLQFAMQLKPETVQFYPVMVYPGTEAYNWYDQQGLIATQDFSKWLTPSGLHNTVIRGEQLSSKELVDFCDQARRKFYLRPSYLTYKVWQMLTTPKEIGRNLKALKTFAKYLVRGSDVDEKKC